DYYCRSYGGSETLLF
nr:immunoglobulin light chain junction region [Macaca mulatta]